MQPWGILQINEATSVFFMTLRGCFISEIVFRLHIYSLRTDVALLGKKMSSNQNAEL